MMMTGDHPHDDLFIYFRFIPFSPAPSRNKQTLHPSADRITNAGTLLVGVCVCRVGGFRKKGIPTTTI